MTEAAIDFNDIDLTDSKHFVDGVPHEWFTFLRHNAPVWWHEEADGPGFWAVTAYNECVAVNRDYEHFSSAKKATFIWELEEELLEQQQLMMLNMDPPLHTRYRRLVNKGFTPRMVAQLHDRIHLAADRIIDNVIERGTAEFVTDISAELPLVVIAELLGVPNEDRHKMFDWSNRMIGSQDPEYQTAAAQDTRQTGGLDGALRLCLRAVQPEAGRSPRRPDERALRGGDGGREALRARARALLPAPDRGRKRNHPEPDLRCHGGVLRQSRPVGAPARDRRCCPRRSRRCCGT